MPSKILLGIKSCNKRINFIKACRETWVPAASKFADVVFFVGNPQAGSSEVDDTVRLDVPDDYLGLPFKAVAMAQYSAEREYDVLWSVDDDTYAQPEYLEDEVNSDYWGRLIPRTDPPYTSGFSRGLSRKATQILAQVKATCGYDDPFVGEVLHKEGISILSSDRVILLPKVGGHKFLNFCGLPKNFLAAAELLPDQMRELHKCVLEGRLRGDRLFVQTPREKLPIALR